MSYTCESCGGEILEIDVKCPSCGELQTAMGANHMIGNVVLGQYEIIDVLGQGGMSVVYKGRHRLTEQEVALKLLPPELAMLAQVKSRFVEEAKALAQLDHPNIVHLYNFGEENGCFVLAMQYVHGQTFERMIIDAEQLDWMIAVRIAIDVLRALEYAHGRGIIHRDMKPSNVLVREDDGSATVMDFGIAKMTNSTRLTATGQTMGTVRYMSPEQVRGLQVDPTTDIYSLGATLYEAIFGDTPFDGDTHFEIMTKHLNEPPVPLRDLDLEIPIELDAIILKALQKKPEDRFPDARGFRKELEAVLRQHDIGWAETMRLTRGAMAVSPAKAPTARAGTAPATPDALESAVAEQTSSPAIATPAGGPASSNAPTAALDTAGAGSPATALPGSDATPPKRAETATVAPPNRSFLWVALVGILLLAAGGATLFLTRSRAEDKSNKTAPPDKTPRAVAIPHRLLEPFRPPEISFAIERRFADEQLRIMAPEGWELDQVVKAHSEGHQLFADLLANAKLATEVPRQPMSIAIVPRHVFCNPGVYEEGRGAPPNCDAKEVHYRPKERTLFVMDDHEYFDVNLAVGNATAVCVHTSIPGCIDVALTLDAEYEKRQKTKKKKLGGK